MAPSQTAAVTVVSFPLIGLSSGNDGPRQTWPPREHVKEQNSTGKVAHVSLCFTWKGSATTGATHRSTWCACASNCSPVSPPSSVAAVGLGGVGVALAEEGFGFWTGTGGSHSAGLESSSAPGPPWWKIVAFQTGLLGACAAGELTGAASDLRRLPSATNKTP